MHRPRRSERVAVALGLAAALGFGCNPPRDPLTFDSQAQKLWRKYDPETARRSAAEGRRSLATLADYKPPPAETAEPKKPEPECEGADELKDEIEKLRSKIAELRAKSDEEEKEARKEKKKPEEAKEGEKPKVEHAPSEAKKEHDVDELLTDVKKLEHDLASAERVGHEKSKKKRHASEEPTKKAARDFCEELGYVEKSKAKKSDETEAPARAVDRLDDVEHRLEKLEHEAKSEQPKEASSETASKPKLDELSSELDALERRTDELEGASPSSPKPSAMGRRARRGETASPTLRVEGHVEAASGEQLVVRSDDGELLVLSLSGDTTIHEESERLTPDELPDDAKVDVRAERQGGRLEAKDVSVEKPEK